MQTPWQCVTEAWRPPSLAAPAMMDSIMGQTSKDPGLAAVLSLIVPGVGQFYNGDFLRGLFWLIVTPGLWIGTGGLLGWVCHVIAAITAYRRAGRKKQVLA
jgi:TM2 domain-containing membrane protein YozV